MSLNMDQGGGRRYLGFAFPVGVLPPRPILKIIAQNLTFVANIANIEKNTKFYVGFDDSTDQSTAYHLPISFSLNKFQYSICNLKIKKYELEGVNTKSKSCNMPNLSVKSFKQGFLPYY